MNCKIVVIIQARMSSSRLPAKVLLDIAGQPMLAHVVNRASRAKTVTQVVVATTDDPGDDLVQLFCEGYGCSCYRGSQYDVLDRYYQAAQKNAADIIVRITADCPVIDPGLIDDLLNQFRGRSAVRFGVDENVSPDSMPFDFAANRLPLPWGRTYPIGLDIEVCTFSALETAWREATLPYQREHVMPFFYENPERFRILHVNYHENLGALRWTVDTAVDLELVRAIFKHFPGRTDFSWLEVLDLYRREPELARLNQQIQAKDYREYDHRQAESK